MLFYRVEGDLAVQQQRTDCMAETANIAAPAVVALPVAAPASGHEAVTAVVAAAVSAFFAGTAVVAVSAASGAVIAAAAGLDKSCRTGAAVILIVYYIRLYKL